MKQNITLPIIPSTNKNNNEKTNNNLETNLENENNNNNESQNYLDNLGSKTLNNFNIKNSNLNKFSKTTFTGFYNKKFNLTLYSQQRAESRSRSKSPERIYTTTKPLTNGIPENILERLEFLSTIFEDKNFIKYYKEIPKRNKNDIEKVCKHILKFKGKNGEIDNIAMIFYYITNEFNFDENGLNLKRNNDYNQSVDYIYRNGIALNQGFCNIFEYFLKKLNIKYKYIQGFCKLIGENDIYYVKKKFDLNLKKLKFNHNYKNLVSKTEINNNEDFIINHCWNALYIKGKWYFVDCYFGMGGHTTKKFNPYYFLTPADYLLYTHFPSDNLFQFSNKIITFNQFLKKRFLNLGLFYREIYLKKIKNLNYTFPLIEINSAEKNNLKIKLEIIDNVIYADLLTKNNEKINDVKYNVDDNNNNYYIFEPSFPFDNGEFLISIKARDINSTDLLYETLLDYRIKISKNYSFKFHNKYRFISSIMMPSLNNTRNRNNKFPKLSSKNAKKFQTKIINDYSKIFPDRKKNKKICFDNENIFILEPRVNILKVNNNYKFKIRIKRKPANLIVLVDGKNFINFKKINEEIFELDYTITTENVTICLNIDKFIYTEFYRFKVITERSYSEMKFNKTISNFRIKNKI